MKLIINTASTYKGGGVQVARSFIEECKRYNEHEYHVIMGEQLTILIDHENFPDNFTFYEIGYRPATRVISLKSRTGFFKELEEKVKPNVVFTTSGPAYWRPKAPHLVGYNLPHYVYSDSPFFSRISVFERLKWVTKGAVIKHFFKEDADAYVVQTDDVNIRLRMLLKTNCVHTVSNTYSHYYHDPEYYPEKLPEKMEKEFRMLSLSAWYRHKNLKVIMPVLDAIPGYLKDHLRFVLTLPEEVFNRVFPAEYHESIINIGPVKPVEGPSLYQECDALFLPTLLECFSASYAEAMKMEIPILTSDLGFARSICGDAALYVDPVDPMDIAKKIEMFYSDSSLRNRLVENGKKQVKTFATAETRAKKYLRICSEMAI